MARIAFTLTIDEEERAALENLSKVERRPVNQLLNEAVKSYLTRQGQREISMEANLARLREYRMKDPGFQRAIDAFAEAEVSLEDPAEGEPMIGEFVDGQFKPAGPVQNKIRELLGA
jgi:predicted transcriptional regulator